jgi:hypothetical protein
MIIILLLSYSIESFISNNVLISKVKLCSSKTNNNVEDGVNLLCLNDIQSDSIWLANSIEKWFNEFEQTCNNFYANILLDLQNSNI